MNNLFSLLNLQKQNSSVLSYIDSNYITGSYWGVGITSIAISSYFIYSYLNQSKAINKDNKEDLNNNQQVNSPPSIASDDTIRNKDSINVYSNNPDTYIDPFDSNLMSPSSDSYFDGFRDHVKAYFASKYNSPIDSTSKFESIPQIKVTPPIESIPQNNVLSPIVDINIDTNPFISDNELEIITRFKPEMVDASVNTNSITISEVGVNTDSIENVLTESPTTFLLNEVRDTGLQIDTDVPPINELSTPYVASNWRRFIVDYFERGVNPITPKTVVDANIGTSPKDTITHVDANIGTSSIITVTSFEEINTIPKLTTDANVGTISNLASTIIEYLL